MKVLCSLRKKIWISSQAYKCQLLLTSVIQKGKLILMYLKERVGKKKKA